MGRETGSWLSGPSAALPDGAQYQYRGQRWELPREGVGSLATTGRRLLALLLDWVPCAIIAYAFVGSSNYQGALTMGIWLAVGIFSVAMFGFSPGQYFVGLRVSRIAGATLRVGLGRAIGRSGLLMIVIPAVIQLDGRGLHDIATGTVVVRSR